MLICNALLVLGILDYLYGIGAFVEPAYVILPRRHHEKLLQPFHWLQSFTMKDRCSFQYSTIVIRRNDTTYSWESNSQLVIKPVISVSGWRSAGIIILFVASFRFDNCIIHDEAIR